MQIDDSSGLIQDKETMMVELKKFRSQWNYSGASIREKLM